MGIENHSLLDDKEHTTEKQREVACEMTRLTEEAINRVCDAFEYLQLEMVNRFAPFEDDQPPAA